jgi:hypothetical protein
MHKIAVDPRELYTLWADGSGGGVEGLDLERCDHIDALRNTLFPCRAICQPAGGP